MSRATQTHLAGCLFETPALAHFLISICQMSLSHFPQMYLSLRQLNYLKRCHFLATKYIFQGVRMTFIGYVTSIRTNLSQFHFFHQPHLLHFSNLKKSYFIHFSFSTFFLPFQIQSCMNIPFNLPFSS